MGALEKIIQHLSLFKQTPEHGIAVFCGNVGDEQDKWVLESIIPPEPLEVRVYRCDQVFFTKPLEEMLKPKDVYGLVVIERREATLSGGNCGSFGSWTDLVFESDGSYTDTSVQNGKCYLAIGRC